MKRFISALFSSDAVSNLAGGALLGGGFFGALAGAWSVMSRRNDGNARKRPF
jgi:hypothetical protein